ncbi:MAG: hypothetical protein ACYDA3_11225 [Gaiellaceae bacterium]
MRTLLESYRWRRRLMWVGGAVLGIAGLAAAAIVLPNQNGGHYKPATGTALPQTYDQLQTQVKVTAAERRDIDATLAAFIRAGVAREDPAAAWQLATPAMRSSVTRAQWNSGTLPVVPFPARTGKPGWTTLTSYPGDVTVDLMLHSRPGTNRGSIAFAVELKRMHGRWLVDSMVPEQSFSPPPRAAKPLPPNFSVSQPHGALGPIWFVVPALLLGIAVLTPVGFGVRAVIRHRSIERRYREGRL